MATRQATITVPDIGNFSEVEIIDILVQPGDSVSAEDALITLESEQSHNGYSLPPLAER